MPSAKPDPRMHVIYRGCTHPATVLGVPVVPFVLCAVTFSVPGFWLLPLGVKYALIFWLPAFPAFAALRLASRKDPYTLIQFGRRLRMRLPHRNKVKWTALTFSPLRSNR